MTKKLTDPEFIRKLEGLWLLARKVLGGTLQADRKSMKKGSGLTFADYSEYSLGDDYRSIDWRVYARLESLVIKLFELEEDVTIYFMLDCSMTMQRKIDIARQLIASLAFIGLHQLDRIVIYGFNNELVPIMPKTHGRGKALLMLNALESVKLGGNHSDFNECCKHLHVRHPKKGVVIVASDFLFPGGYEQGLKLLNWCKHDVFCIQTLDKEDLAIDARGDLNLECVESGENMKVTVNQAVAEEFAQAIAKYNNDLQRFCARQKTGFVRTMSNDSFEDVIQKILRKGGLVA